jgi:glycosyltransferase involved in cell wall biosynthesis
MHDVVPLDHPEWLTRKFVAWYRWLIPRLCHRARRVIAISEFTKGRLIEACGVPSERVVVIPNGVDQRFSPRPAHDTDQVQRTLGLPTKHYVLSLGSLEPRKNVLGLMAAWTQLERRLPEDIHLVVAGGRGKRAIFADAAYARIPNRVHFTDRVADEYLPSLLSGALAFVYPSMYEGFGLPVLEAMATGTPVITSDRTALPEVAGGAALHVNPYDIDSIAWAIERIVCEPELRADLRVRGLSRAHELTWDRAAQRTADLLLSEATRD